MSSSVLSVAVETPKNAVARFFRSSFYNTKRGVSTSPLLPGSQDVPPPRSCSQQQAPDLPP